MAKVCRFPEVTRRMVRSDNSWSQLVLPLKRYNDQNFMETGYLLDPVPEGKPITICLGNIFMVKMDDPQLVYENVDALINDGWEVD